MGNQISLRDGNIYLVSGSVKKSIGQSGPNTDSPPTASIEPNTTGSEYKTFLTLDTSDNSSFIISGSNPTSSFYMSSSGKFGFGTTDPLVSFDIRSDEFQVQKQGKRQGIRVNNEGNIESFNAESTAAATGSEFILSYTRGGTGEVSSIALQKILGVSSDEITKAGGATAFFNGLRGRDQDKILFLMERQGLIASASIGDVLGSIRWIASSGSVSDKDRTAGEAATIQAVVNASNKFGVSADLLFKVADKAALEGASSDLGAAGAPKTALLLDGNFNHELTGSLKSTGNITSPNITADSGSFSTRVTANDAKTGISTSQASAITANTAKKGISTAQTTLLTALAKGITNATGHQIKLTLNDAGALVISIDRSTYTISADR